MPKQTTEERRAARRRYYAANRERLSAQRVAWGQRNRDKENVRKAQYVARNKEAIREQQRLCHIERKANGKYDAYYSKYYSDPARRMRAVLYGAKKRAAAAGLPFDLQLRKLLVSAPPVHCVCCGVTLDYSVGRGKGKHFASRSPSIDRLDNCEGYTVQNCRCICMRCNRVKGDASIAELWAVLSYSLSSLKPG